MQKINLSDKKLFNCLVKTLLVFYLIILTWVIFFKCGLSAGIKEFYIQSSSNYSLSYRFYRCIIPFTKIIVKDSKALLLLALDWQDALNVIVFIPFGFLVSYFICKKRKVILYALCVSIIFETMQFFTLIGAFATKDIITNVFGSFLGMIVFNVYNKKTRFSKVHNICAIVVLFCAIVITVVAIYTVVINFDDYLFVLQRKR